MDTHVGRSNVWVAEIREKVGRWRLNDLRQVQALAGDGHPCDRLIAYLGSGDYQAAALDAPFSIAEEYVPRL